MRTLALAALALSLVACSPDKPDADDEDTQEANLRIGQLMVETGHRFETSGRAATAARWGLARYEAHEIIELFEADMPRALLPGECNDDIADQMYFGLMQQRLPALVTAAEGEDRAAYTTAFAAAAQQCNGCHATCGVPFVEVPSAPGLEVPSLRPRGGSPAPPGPATEVLDPWANDPPSQEPSRDEPSGDEPSGDSSRGSAPQNPF